MSRSIVSTVELFQRFLDQDVAKGFLDLEKRRGLISIPSRDLSEKVIVDKNGRSSRNKTISLSESEKDKLSKEILLAVGESIEDAVIHGDSLQIMSDLPGNFVDLLIVDPPYNLNKVYSSSSFKKMNDAEYQNWLEKWISLIPGVLKPNASIYICCDWSCSEKKAEEH